MSLNEFRWGLTLLALGDLMIAYLAMSAHRAILKEKKIDTKVLIFMTKERYLGFVGVVFIIVGYFLELQGI